MKWLILLSMFIIWGIWIQSKETISGFSKWLFVPVFLLSLCTLNIMQLVFRYLIFNKIRNRRSENNR